jgi:hypothetical protein
MELNLKQRRTKGKSGGLEEKVNKASIKEWVKF